MIQANELRIGNWVNLGLRDDIKNYGKVLSIGSLEQKFEQVYCECEESFEWAFKDNYCGIPLTPEILNKCGFKKDLDTKQWSNPSDTVGILIDEHNRLREKRGLEIDERREGFFVETYYSYIELEYLHQLQNLYFSLTGTELVINL